MNLEWMAQHSFVNCHAIGLDSILFKEKNPATGQGELRAFITQKHHTLWQNWLPNVFSLAIHPHHCDLTLIPRFGLFWNVRPGRVGHSNRLRNAIFNLYNYQSQIKTGEGRIKPTGVSAVPALEYELVQIPTFMRAYELHTVYVPAKLESAWFVQEGPEDAQYRPIMWSNDDQLEKFDFQELYQPMSVSHLVKCLLKMGIDYHQHQHGDSLCA